MAFESEHVPQIIQAFNKVKQLAEQKQRELNELYLQYEQSNKNFEREDME